MEDNPGVAETLVGIEVGKTRITTVALDSDGELLEDYSEAVDPADEPTSQIGKAVAKAHERFGEEFVLGVALPGLLKSGTGQIVHSALIPEHEEVDLVSELRHYTDLGICFENDANAAAYGELVKGAGRGSKDIFYITLGAGVGGALILNGKLWRGAAGYAGEFGYIAVNSEGMRLEDVASTANIIRRTKNWFHQDPTSSLNAVGEDNITIADVVRAAEDEDDFAQLMLQRTGMYVGGALAGVINLLNLEKVIVGGEIMQARGLVLDGIRRRARELSFRPSFESVTIAEGELGLRAGAIGAALIAGESAAGG
ncbi:MAG: ROK family protein [Acidobacteria bacterium]|nr:MAG: ROK family protein [Acidobacteriota bacterium]REK04142.1 MAG: ROK family protein [Acidobacteriota bacterium]REK15304.1 MAG: ROK family protein [Acidobacteriota bacterium]REK46394.1 MAG: ROK family protein [Acidobacteriota bacterium]